jgi:hypothetical protein
MSIHIPDRHSRTSPPQGPVPPLVPPGGVPGPPPVESLGGPPPQWTQGPPPGWHAPLPQPASRPPRRRRRLLIGLAIAAVAVLALLGGFIALLGWSGIVVDDLEGDGGSFVETFDGTDVAFELFDDGMGSAAVRDGALVLESSVGDMLDYSIVGPMDSTQVTVDVLPGTGSYAGPAIGVPYTTPDDGWYVTAQVTDAGRLYLFDSARTVTETATDVVAEGGATVTLEMTYTADRTEQVFTAVLMEPVARGVWVSVEASRLSLTVPARETSAVAVMVGPVDPAAADGSFDPASGTFDNYELSYEPAG